MQSQPRPFRAFTADARALLDARPDDPDPSRPATARVFSHEDIAVIERAHELAGASDTPDWITAQHLLAAGWQVDPESEEG